MKHIGILAIDFDNTIAQTTFPLITGEVPFAVEAIKHLSKKGWFIIINTCRSGEHEKEAIEWLKEKCVPYDLLNENHPQLIDVFTYDCRKISADIYIDDKNIDAVGEPVDWLSVYIKIGKLEDDEKFCSMLSLVK